MDPADLADLAARVELPDQDARAATVALADRIGPTPGATGRLAAQAGWLSGLQGQAPPAVPAQVRLLVVAADHGIAEAGVSAHDSDATEAAVARLRDGSAPGAVLAAHAGVAVRVVDAGTRAAGPVSGRIDREDALDLAQVHALLRRGVALADEQADSGTDLLLLGSVGVAGSTPAAAVVGLLARIEPSLVVGRASGIDDHAWMRKVAAIRDAMRRGRPVLADHPALLATSGGADLSLLTGVLVGAAVRRTPVLLDGVVPAAAALLAHRIAYRGAHWWTAATLGVEPAQRAAVDRLGIDPVLGDLPLRVDQGVGALLALPLLRDAVRLVRTTRAEGDPAGAP